MYDTIYLVQGSLQETRERCGLPALPLSSRPERVLDTKNTRA